jgi:hypothetical protein
MTPDDVFISYAHLDNQSWWRHKGWRIISSGSRSGRQPRKPASDLAREARRKRLLLTPSARAMPCLTAISRYAVGTDHVA